MPVSGPQDREPLFRIFADYLFSKNREDFNLVPVIEWERHIEDSAIKACETYFHMYEQQVIDYLRFGAGIALKFTKNKQEFISLLNNSDYNIICSGW